MSCSGICRENVGNKYVAKQLVITTFLVFQLSIVLVNINGDTKCSSEIEDFASFSLPLRGLLNICHVDLGKLVV